MKSLICYFACSLVLLLSISEGKNLLLSVNLYAIVIGCKEIYPSFVNKHFLSNNCGKTIELKYEISKYNYIVVDVNGNGCSIHKNMYHITKVSIIGIITNIMNSFRAFTIMIRVQSLFLLSVTL